MFAVEKGTKYYIHLMLYFVIIILLSVSLSGPWIKYKDEGNFISLDFQFNLFKVKLKSEVNTLKFLEELFTIDVFPMLDNQVNNEVNNEVNNSETNPTIDEPLKKQILLKHFTSIKVIEDIDIKDLNLKDVRNQLVNTINLGGDKIEFNGVTYRIELKDSDGSVKTLDYVEAELLETVNNLFNKSRSEDNNIDDMDRNVQKKYVKSGELKNNLSDIEKYVKQFFKTIQIVIIICIVLLFLHFLLILFKGRRTGIFRFSGIITVFLPMLAIVFLAAIYILLAAVDSDIMTVYYLIYTIASLLLFVTWFLGLIKAI